MLKKVQTSITISSCPIVGGMHVVERTAEALRRPFYPSCKNRKRKQYTKTSTGPLKCAIAIIWQQLLARPWYWVFIFCSYLLRIAPQYVGGFYRSP
ncbi:unnamed protein product [Amoebophrya sp. A120]|nr:unnamed protein product [Amoebophrya sp. A120]|eukprot:GSA120T00015148001.1